MSISDNVNYIKCEESKFNCE